MGKLAKWVLGAVGFGLGGNGANFAATIRETLRTTHGRVSASIDRTNAALTSIADVCARSTARRAAASAGNTPP